DVGAIKRTNGNGTIHHELHVTGTRGFFTCGGNLLGQIGTRSNHLHGGNTIVGDKHYFELVANIRVVVHHISYVVNQLDDQLGHVITRRCLTTKDYYAVGPVFTVATLDAVIQV